VIIPYACDNPKTSLPIGNYIIIGAAVVAFAFVTSNPAYDVKSFVLSDWSLKSLLGHMWLHGGYFHIITNMVFLWCFGNALCPKLGSLCYVLAYVGLGVASGCFELVFDGRPGVGASGAVFGVIGMYFVFYPWDDVRCLFFLPPFFKRFRIAGFWMILWWFFLNLVGMMAGLATITHVGYMVHVAGFGVGVLLAWLLVKLKAVERDDMQEQVIRNLWKPEG
jgi:membrane associated rhomboid family serine protease